MHIKYLFFFTFFATIICWNKKKAEGVRLGRPRGRSFCKSSYKLHASEQQIAKMRTDGMSFRKIADILHVNRDTVRNYYYTFINEKA